MNSPPTRLAPWSQARHDSAWTLAVNPESPREARFDVNIKSMSQPERDSPEPNYRLHSERQLERRSLDNSSQAYDRGVLNKIGGPKHQHRSSVSSNSIHDSPLLMSSPSFPRAGMKHDRQVSDARTSVTDSPPPSTSPEVSRAKALSPRPEQLAGTKRRASNDLTRPYYPQPTSDYQPLHHASSSISSGQHVSPQPERSPSSLPSITTLDHELRKRGPETQPPWQAIQPAVHTGSFICDCCPKKPKRFLHEEDLRLHHLEKQYTCLYCPNRFKNKNEAERHQNSLHLRRHSWSCAALQNREDAFHSSLANGGATDQCGYCGDEFSNPPNWPARFEHLDVKHKFGECNQSKKFFRADHFRQHLKHSHAGTSGKWTNMLENACMRDEAPPVPMDRSQMPDPGPPGVSAPSSVQSTMSQPMQQGTVKSAGPEELAGYEQPQT